MSPQPRLVAASSGTAAAARAMDNFLDWSKNEFAKTAASSHLAFLEVVTESSILFDVVAGRDGAVEQRDVAPTMQSPVDRVGAGSAVHPHVGASSSGAASSSSGAVAASASARPWPVAKRPKCEQWVPDELKSDKYTPEEIIQLRAEAAAAIELNVKWRDRGPPKPDDPSEKWRGQAWRESSGRWANRGGVAREWYTAFYKAKKQGQEHLDAWLRDNPKPR